MTEIPDCQIDDDSVLSVICTKKPTIPVNQIARDTLNQVKMADVRFLNVSDKFKPWNDWSFTAVTGGFDFDQDSDRMQWPLYRDWTQEAAQLSRVIIKSRNAILQEEMKRNTNFNGEEEQPFQYSFALQELVNAERLYYKLIDDFKVASVYAVHAIVKKAPAPLNLLNLLGEGGEKYVVGGIYLRRAQGWTVCGQQFKTFEAYDETDVFGSGIHADLSEISAKLAALDVRNGSLLRNKVENLVVPLSCVVDYFGLRFEAISIIPASINSLAYGSDTDGLVFKDNDKAAEQMAEQIGKLLNLKPHTIRERATQIEKKAYLPYSVQLHRNHESPTDKQFYLFGCGTLFPSEESLRSATRVPPPQELMSKQLRPELVLNHHRGDLMPNLQYYTWKNPVRCDECGEIIFTHTYFYYSRTGVSAQ